MNQEIARLRECLRYEPETGELYWRAGRGPNKAGSRAGSMDRHGYRKVMCNRKTYLAHRLAWMIFYGEEPPKYLDHINRNPTDNRICNLRPADLFQNMSNILQTRNKHGFRGVSQIANGKYAAYIRHCRKAIYLGTFLTPEDAWEGYKQASIQLKGEYSPFAAPKEATHGN